MSDITRKNKPLGWKDIRAYLTCDQDLFRVSEVFEVISSTNDWALEQCRSDDNLPAICLAESQQNGRGRRGRSWVSSSSRNIYLSIAWAFDSSLQDLTRLPLVIGVALVRFFRDYEIDAGIKWPNDILVNQRKIAGILLETRSSSKHKTKVVIGVGVNVDMSTNDAAQIEQPWTDFISECPNKQYMDKNQLVGDLLSKIVLAIQEFVAQGFDGFRNEWQEYDLCIGKQVVVTMQDQLVYGTAIDLDETGAIKVRIENGEEQLFNAADISLRVL